MPRKNVLKEDVSESYYHVYTRGINKGAIFEQPKDYHVFLNLLKRYLSENPAHDNNGLVYPHLFGAVEVLAFCLMPNHIHLFLYQKDRGAMASLMRGVMTSYSRYFNKNYKRCGPLFESRYKATLIDNQAYLEHISRYIHLNHSDWRDYPYSSLPYYIDGWRAEWVKPQKILSLFKSETEYLGFVRDYEDQKRKQDDLREELADI